VNRIRENFFLLITFVLILVSFISFSVWNPFKKESWEAVTKLIEEGYKGVEKGVGEVSDSLSYLKHVAYFLDNLKDFYTEPPIKSWAVRPMASTKLHEFMWVCTHNAFSSSAHGYGIYRQQNTSMVNQLKAGVRALMLDVRVAKGKVLLVHGPSKYDKILRPLSSSKMKLSDELKIMKKEFFDKDREAVVFIILQEYITDRKLLNRSFEQSGLAERILKPSEWNPVIKEGWPTIGWMNDRGKQIIVFTDNKTKYIYPMHRNMVENNYDKIDNIGASVERTKSKEFDFRKRYLFLFNFFKDSGEAPRDISSTVRFLQFTGYRMGNLNYSKINDKKLRDAINYAITKGSSIFRNRYPNFLAVDFVEEGDVFDIADEFNRKARVEKSKMFRVMTTNNKKRNS